MKQINALFQTLTQKKMAHMGKEERNDYIDFVFHVHMYIFQTNTQENIMVNWHRHLPNGQHLIRLHEKLDQ